jgi:hypothetical protein
LKIFKFLRPEWKALLLVFLLLTAQAASELSLPGITSSLVNVGVQQDGIEDALAQRLSSESMGKLLALTDDAGRAAVGIAYEAQGAIFRLREGLTEAERAAAREALTLPMAITLMTQALPAGTAKPHKGRGFPGNPHCPDRANASSRNWQPGTGRSAGRRAVCPR